MDNLLNLHRLFPLSADITRDLKNSMMICVYEWARTNPLIGEEHSGKFLMFMCDKFDHIISNYDPSMQKSFSSYLIGSCIRCVQFYNKDTYEEGAMKASVDERYLEDITESFDPELPQAAECQGLYLSEREREAFVDEFVSRLDLHSSGEIETFSRMVGVSEETILDRLSQWREKEEKYQKEVDLCTKYFTLKKELENKLMFSQGQTQSEIDKTKARLNQVNDHLHSAQKRCDAHRTIPMTKILRNSGNVRKATREHEKAFSSAGQKVVRWVN